MVGNCGLGSARAVWRYCSNRDGSCSWMFMLLFTVDLEELALFVDKIQTRKN